MSVRVFKDGRQIGGRLWKSPVWGGERAGREAVRTADASQGSWAKIAERIERGGLSLADSDAKGLRRRMLAAGFRSPNAPKIFTLVRIVLIFALPSILLLPQFVSGKQISILSLYLQGAFFALMGLVVPNLFLTDKDHRHHQEILNALQTCLDFMHYR